MSLSKKMLLAAVLLFGLPVTGWGADVLVPPLRAGSRIDAIRQRGTSVWRCSASSHG